MARPMSAVELRQRRHSSPAILVHPRSLTGSDSNLHAAAEHVRMASTQTWNDTQRGDTTTTSVTPPTASAPAVPAAAHAAASPAGRTGSQPDFSPPPALSSPALVRSGPEVRSSPTS